MINPHQRMTILLAIILLGPACQTKDDYYCEGARLDNCSLIGTCTHPSHCSSTPDTPACDLSVSSIGNCVVCTATDPGACHDTTPVCRNNKCDKCMKGDCGSRVCQPDGSCANCTQHGDCDSGACLPDGLCGSDTNVAYVDPNGSDNTMCTKAMPCTLVRKALATNRPYVKFTGTTNELVTVDSGKVVTFLAELGSKLNPMGGGGAIVTVRDNMTSLTVYDLEISNATGSSGIGIMVPLSAADLTTVTLIRARVINNEGGGISTTGGTLTVSQSTISGNIGGGIKISGGQFDLTNNFIAGNGNGSSTLFGGVLFDGTNTGMRRFEFNTVANNKCMMSLASGITCSFVTDGVTFSNNIIYSNLTGNNRTQVSATTQSANCSWTYSDIGPGTAVTGIGNFNTPPMFVDLAQNDLHLSSTSPARNAADPNATLAVDIDREGRPQPQGERRDIGADEVP